MKQRAETKADIEKKIDQCNRSLKRISDRSNELKAVSADLGKLAASLIPCPPSAIARERRRQPPSRHYASAGQLG